MEEMKFLEVADAIIETIIEAVKKQIPQKPLNLKKDEYGVYRADCPRCGYDFPDVGGAMESLGYVEQYDYCPECGQRINWEEVMQ